MERFRGNGPRAWGIRPVAVRCAPGVRKDAIRRCAALRPAVRLRKEHRGRLGMEGQTSPSPPHLRGDSQPCRPLLSVSNPSPTPTGLHPPEVASRPVCRPPVTASFATRLQPPVLPLRLKRIFAQGIQLHVKPRVMLPEQETSVDLVTPQNNRGRRGHPSAEQHNNEGWDRMQHISWLAVQRPRSEWHCEPAPQHTDFRLATKNEREPHHIHREPSSECAAAKACECGRPGGGVEQAQGGFAGTCRRGHKHELRW